MAKSRYKDPLYMQTYRKANRERLRKYYQSWRQKRLKDGVSQRKDNLYFNYKMSLEDYDMLFEKQNGACAICLKTTKGNLHVDHDHTTGEIRGLLCKTCNMGLGCLGDNEDGLIKALKYLKKEYA